MIFSSESVTEGHPDKICDQISDAILDALLAKDPSSRVACETLVKTGMVVLAGEVTSDAWVDFPEIARKTVIDIGFDRSDYGFDGHTCAVLAAVEAQSPEISQGVAGQGAYNSSDGAKEQGAGDQGMMFGFACDQSKELMPLPIMLSHQLTKRLSVVRKDKTLPWLRPDGKSQVSIRYDQQDNSRKAVSAEAIVISTQHDPDLKHAQIKEAIIEHVIKPIVPAALMSSDTAIFVNPTGSFVTGGPMGDCGLTGRKIIVDTYGGWGRHGGGAFSGKDPSKVDRSAAYYARYIAKNIIAAGLAKEAEVQLAYAIGVAKPVSLLVDSFGTGTVSDEKITAAVDRVFDCRPQALIESLGLLKPIYGPTSAYGHFGREPNGDQFSWEKTDKVDALKSAI